MCKSGLIIILLDCLPSTAALLVKKAKKCINGNDRQSDSCIKNKSCMLNYIDTFEQMRVK